MPSHKISTAELRLCVLTKLANYLPYTAKVLLRLAFVAGAVIQAIGRPEFEDGLRTGVLLQDC